MPLRICAVDTLVPASADLQVCLVAFAFIDNADAINSLVVFDWLIGTFVAHVYRACMGTVERGGRRMIIK